jgi:TRAP-type C4-dicarboxylate transport system permease small subunit
MQGTQTIRKKKKKAMEVKVHVTLFSFLDATLRSKKIPMEHTYSPTMTSCALIFFFLLQSLGLGAMGSAH